jgi:hypothetical protein
VVNFKSLQPGSAFSCFPHLKFRTNSGISAISSSKVSGCILDSPVFHFVHQRQAYQYLLPLAALTRPLSLQMQRVHSRLVRKNSGAPNHFVETYSTHYHQIMPYPRQRQTRSSIFSLERTAISARTGSTMA